jgi:uncharacterized membrane protein
MAAVELVIPVAVLAWLAWFAYRFEPRATANATIGPERLVQSLRERLRHGEITAEDYRRLIALIS